MIKFLEKGVLNPTDIKILVLDEADRLLELGFMDEVKQVVSFMRNDHQAMLFSVTFPHGIKALSEDLLKDPAQVTVDSQHQANAIDQFFF